MWGIRTFALIVAAGGLLMVPHSGAKADPRPWAIGVSDLQGEADWSGFYIGGKLGGAWGNVDWTQDTNIFTNGGAVASNASADFSPSGFGGGVIGGANLQTGKWVFGAEFTFSGVDFSSSIASPYFPATDAFSTKIDWITTVEGRIGYAWDQYLLYGKGGWAGGQAALTLVAGNRTATTGATADHSGFYSGWTIGGGLDYLCWSNVVLGLEYDYITLNLSGVPSCPLCASGITGGSAPALVSGDATVSTVMVRASYLFRPED
jgi:outer membrane immunogenic protein